MALNGFWSRLQASARIAFEEMDRSRVASTRYDELRTGWSTDLPFRERGSKARQVFVEIYADIAMQPRFAAPQLNTPDCSPAGALSSQR